MVKGLLVFQKEGLG